MMSVSIERKTTKQYLQEYFVVGGVYDETTRLFFYRRESMYFTKEKGGSDRLSSITYFYSTWQLSRPGFC